VFSLLRLLGDHPQAAEAATLRERQPASKQAPCDAPPPAQPPHPVEALPAPPPIASSNDDPWAVLHATALTPSQRAAQAVHVLLECSGLDEAGNDEDAVVAAVQTHCPVKINRLYLLQAWRLKQRRAALFAQVMAGTLAVYRLLLALGWASQ
jgi:hypothetical protein